MHRHFNALAGFGMDAVAIEKFQFLGARREPGFVQAMVIEGEVEFTLRAENFDGKGVEEFVGEEDQGRFGSESAVESATAEQGSAGQAGAPFASAGQALPLRELCRNPGARAEFLAVSRGARATILLQGVGYGSEEVGEFLVRPIEHIAGEQATAWAEFEDFDLRRAIEGCHISSNWLARRRPKTA